MKTSETTSAGRALPPSVASADLRRHIAQGETPTLVDVREREAFVARHIAGSVHAPDSQTTGLVKKVQTLGRAVLICEDGRHSAMVARTLGFCGFREIAYLEGGLAAWTAAGGGLVYTTRSGFEHELPPPDAPGTADTPTRGWLGRLQRILHRAESP